MTATNGGRFWGSYGEGSSAFGGRAARPLLDEQALREAHACVGGAPGDGLTKLAGERRAIPVALALARHALEMEIAVLSEVSDQQETVLWAVGDASRLGLFEGARVPLEKSLAQPVLDRGATVVTDTAGDRRMRGLAIVRRESGVRACIGVGLIYPGGKRYALCCLDHRPRPDLADGELRFLRGIRESLRPGIEALP